jgi:hypothetical protein
MPVTSSSTSPPKIVKSNKSNPLNYYSSYNYVFTLASLSKEALSDPTSYRKSENYFVIARSGGKGTGGINTPKSASPTLNLNFDAQMDQVNKNIENRELINGFNKNSPGRFDFFINNVRIETLMGANEQTNMSVATKIEFDIIEPYSMSGFIEALQVASVAAGYQQYINAPFMLKMEFIGYPDGSEIAETAQTVPDSTRYFVLTFTGLNIDVTENGAKYNCKCVPFNERAFGQPSQLTASTKIKGTTVGELLKDFEKALNDAKKSDTENERNQGQSNNFDSYEIIVPNVDDTGIISNETNRKILDSKIVEFLKSNAVYAFDDPAETSSKSKSSPTDPVVMFSAGMNIHECIISIVCNSTYLKDILKDLSNAESKTIDQYGMVDYFTVNLEVIDKGTVDDKTNKPFYNYLFIVLPYKIHCTRIPLIANQPIDTSKFLKVANRTYNYLYTGANVDIKTFQLKFNTLFFQAIPKALGNKSDRPTTSESVSSIDPVDTALQNVSADTRKLSSTGISPIKTSIDQTKTFTSPQPVAGQRNQSDPYDDLARNMHQAILENTDQCSLDMEIIGDPFYLVTASMGNYRPKANPDGTVGEGEAPYITGDVMVVIIFKNPVDIDEITGEAIFSDKVTPYSGIFRVLSVNNTFIDGIFMQKLHMIRVPGQLNIDTTKVPKMRAGIINSVDNPAQASTVVPAEPPSTVRASTTNLAAEIASKILPSTGLPGSLSKFASSVGGPLLGAATVATSVGTLLNSTAGGAGSSALSGLQNVSSSLRLINSGLSALSTNINSAGASISQISDTANSVGLKINSASDLANTSLVSGVGSASSLGTSAMSAVKGLGTDAAGLVSSVSSKIDGLKGSSAALASQLGVDVSKLAGLSPDLKAKIETQLSDAAKSIPDGVDLSSAVKKGLIVNNIPTAALSNIPATQPEAIAPAAAVSLSDLKAIIAQGGSIANIPGASSIPGINSILPKLPNLSLSSLPDTGMLSDKLASAQSSFSKITGDIPSVESAIGNINASIPGGLKTTADTALSVTSKFGSISSSINSPLDTIMKINRT